MSTIQNHTTFRPSPPALTGPDGTWVSPLCEELDAILLELGYIREPGTDRYQPR